MKIIVFLLGFGLIAYGTCFNLYTRQSVNAWNSNSDFGEVNRFMLQAILQF